MSPPAGIYDGSEKLRAGCGLVHFHLMSWKRMLAYVTGFVDDELLARNEYLVTENRKAESDSPILNESAWLRRPNDWDAKRWKRLRRSSDRKRFWGGTAGWSPRSLTV